MTSSPITTDYSTWSREDLLKRIAQLESQKNEHLPPPTTSSSPTTPAAASEPTKKANPPFDPSKYTTRHIALKFAYLGARYNGFEHHIGNPTPLPTIEAELWKALAKTRLIFPPSLYGDGGEVDRVGEGVVGDWNGCRYSKCGRTDRGVSAFGQVIGVEVRSSRPLPRANVETDGGTVQGWEVTKDVVREGEVNDTATTQREELSFDDVRDELPYIALLNRVLPPDIRVLAWCPHPPVNFDARFSCKERKYRYFFTSPAILPLPGAAGLSTRTGNREGWLDIPAMQEAASYLVGSHDFRNFCKVDPTKQLTNFVRRISEAKIEFVTGVPSPDFVAEPRITGMASNGSEMGPVPQEMKLYTFDVKGSAFLWHQVRCMVAIMFLVGQGLEKPSVVKELLNVEKNPRKPTYEMASDQPLVLWDTMFSTSPDKGKFGDGEKPQGYIDRGIGADELMWVYAADTGPGNPNQVKWGPSGLMADLWRGWRKAKMDEVLTSQLMDLVASQGEDDLAALEPSPKRLKPAKENQRVFEGYDAAVPRGKYIPVMKKPRMDPVEVINAKWATKRGVNPRFTARNEDSGD